MAKICCIIQIKLNQFKKKYPYDHWLTNKAYLSTITVTNISQSFYLQDAGKNHLVDMEQNYITVTPCICQIKITVMVTRISECSYSYMNIQHPHLTRITYCAWSLVVNIYFPVFLYPDFLYIHIFSILVITNSTESVFNPVRQIVPDIDSSDRHCSW